MPLRAFGQDAIFSVAARRETGPRSGFPTGRNGNQTMHILTVDPAEHGMKLIAFLSRRLKGASASAELHRWIRTGQVRRNGKRAKAFDRINAGDDIRLPPFAAPSARRTAECGAVAPGDILGGTLDGPPGDGSGLRVLAATPGFLALEKPAGLPAQPGSGHRTSAADILHIRFAACAYIPAPVHRLDKDTSGILLAGRTHEAQERLHALFSRHNGGSVTKIYLAWVAGQWPYPLERSLTDNVSKSILRSSDAAGFERVRTVKAGEGKEARCRVVPMETRDTEYGDATLLRVTLETGRTHQIRVQLASRGFPVIGDAKYGAKPFARMLLHAHALTFPWQGETVSIVSYPDWPAPFAVAQGLPHRV